MVDSRQTTGVLVVDDEPKNLKLLKTHLESEDFTVFTADNGEQGFEKLKQHKNDIHLILLNRMMPKLNGMQFLKKLKANESVTNIPVIMHLPVK